MKIQKKIFILRGGGVRSGGGGGSGWGGVMVDGSGEVKLF